MERAKFLKLRFRAVGISSIAAMLAILISALGLAMSSADEATPNEREASFADQIKTTVRTAKDREKRFHDELRYAGREKEKVTKANIDFNADQKALISSYIDSLTAHRWDPSFLDGVIALVADLSYPLP